MFRLEKILTLSTRPSSFYGENFIQKFYGVPPAGASNKGGVGKISSFLSISLNISKTVADTAKSYN